MLKCGVHKCTSRCHQLSDHSRIFWRIFLTQKCLNSHSQQWQCHASSPKRCQKCERDRKEAAKRAQRALEEKLKRDKKIQKHLKEVAKLDEEMEQITRSIEDARLDSEQKIILEQKRMDLAAAKERAQSLQDFYQKEPPGIYNNKKPNPKGLPPEKFLPIPLKPLTSTPSQIWSFEIILWLRWSIINPSLRKSGSARSTKKIYVILQSIWLWRW